MSLFRSDFIERSIMGALSFLKESLFANELATRRGLLQSLDQRIKTATFFLFILNILFTRNLFVLCWLYLSCLLLAWLSRINLIFFLKRTWIFIPLFSLFIAIPALFSIFSPGQTLFVFKCLGWQFIITRQGLFSAGLFAMRVVTSVSFAVLLGLTTRHAALLKVLRIFHVPQVFVMTIGMCYRYTYLFIEIIQDTYTAIKSRTGYVSSSGSGQRLVAWNIASLWQRSYGLSRQVYDAMLSRGFSGEPVMLDDFKARLKDWVWLFLVILFVAFMFYLNGRII